MHEIKPDPKDSPISPVIRIEKLKERVGIKPPPNHNDWHKEKLTEPPGINFTIIWVD